MKVNAIYHADDTKDGLGSIVHCVDHDGGGFMVSSAEVGIAIQNFLNAANLTDISTLHGHLLRAYADRKADIERWKNPSTLRSFVISTQFGERQWMAESDEHAREQHKDAFPDEEIRWVKETIR